MTLRMARPGLFLALLIATGSVSARADQAARISEAADQAKGLEKRIQELEPRLPVRASAEDIESANRSISKLANLQLEKDKALIMMESSSNPSMQKAGAAIRSKNQKELNYLSRKDAEVRSARARIEALDRSIGGATFEAAKASHFLEAEKIARQHPEVLKQAALRNQLELAEKEILRLKNGALMRKRGLKLTGVAGLVSLAALAVQEYLDHASTKQEQSAVTESSVKHGDDGNSRSSKAASDQPATSVALRAE